MISTVIYQLGNILPFLLTIVFAISILIFDVFAQSDKKRYLGYLTSFMLMTVFYFIIRDFANNDSKQTMLFFDSVVIDRFGLIFISIFIISAILTALFSVDYLEKNGINIGEFYSLMLFSTSGMILLVSSYNLFTIFVAIELLSLPVYAIAGLFRINNKSIEASIKYFILGSVASAIFLYGISLIYGVTGSVNVVEIGRYITTNYTDIADVIETDKILLLGMLLILIGILFKMAVAPFHFWTPDVYEGSPTNVTGFMSVSVKIASFGVFIRIFDKAFNNDVLLYNLTDSLYKYSWINILNAFAIISVIVANLVAMSQRNIKRMLGYSAIAHSGYLLIGVIGYFLNKTQDTYASLFIYFISYTFTSLGAFGVLSIFEVKNTNTVNLEDLNGVGYKKPFVSFAMSVFMFSLAGIPPASGFFAKFYLFKSAFVDSNLKTLVIIALITSIFSVFYYLRVIVYMYMKNSNNEIDESTYKTSFSTDIAVAVSLVFVFLLGILPQYFISIIQRSLM